MTNLAANANLESAKQIVIKEIRAKWGKFSEQDLSALKSNGDLVTQLAAKYSLAWISTEANHPNAER